MTRWAIFLLSCLNLVCAGLVSFFLFVSLKFSYGAFSDLYKMSLLSPSWFRLAAEPGTVLGSRPDFFHHTAGTVPGRHGSICRGELSLLS